MVFFSVSEVIGGAADAKSSRKLQNAQKSINQRAMRRIFTGETPHALFTLDSPLLPLPLGSGRSCVTLSEINEAILSFPALASGSLV